MRVHIQGKSFDVVSHPHEEFWSSVDAGKWEPQTFQLLNKYIDRDTTVLDLGGWIGPTALFASQFAKVCHAFEPDPIAFPRLEANLKANAGSDWAHRLVLHRMAISDSGKELQLGSTTGGGDSETSLFTADSASHWTVPSKTLAGFIAELGLQNERLVVKMDVEGAEYSILRSFHGHLAALSAVLLLSIHPKALYRALHRRYSAANPLLRRFLVWRAFFGEHVFLLKALRGCRLTRGDGRSAPRWLMLARAALSQRFPTDLVAISPKFSQRR